ncbi:hypothetical protein C770_GR4Chr2409 [Sinorhizobium meliloti GR4]|nr:hypothetical protein C770_GR4Chr2409 [Sinorhizobium meliloti GR4]
MPRSGAWWLSEFHGEKIRVECECGVRRIYDAKAADARADFADRERFFASGRIGC